MEGEPCGKYGSKYDCVKQDCLKNFRLVFFPVSSYTDIKIFSGGIVMSTAEIEESIRTATISLEMEGLHIDSQYADWCRQMLSGKISMKEYIAMVIERAKG